MKKTYFCTISGAERAFFSQILILKNEVEMTSGNILFLKRYEKWKIWCKLRNLTRMNRIMNDDRRKILIIFVSKILITRLIIYQTLLLFFIWSFIHQKLFSFFINEKKLLTDEWMKNENSFWFDSLRMNDSRNWSIIKE